MVLCGVGHVHDETCATTADVILPAKKGGGQVSRQAVNFLIQVRIHQMKNVAFGGLIGLCVHAVLHKPLGVEIDPGAPAAQSRWYGLRAEPGNIPD